MILRVLLVSFRRSDCVPELNLLQDPATVWFDIPSPIFWNRVYFSYREFPEARSDEEGRFSRKEVYRTCPLMLALVL